MPMVDIEDSIAYRIHRAARILRKHFLKMTERAGVDLTPEQWFCVNKLRLRGELSQNQIADSILEDHANITRLVVGLEKKGMVSRRRDPEDNRRVLVSLTGKGQDVHDRMAETVEDVRADLFDGLSDRQLRAARALLETLEGRAGEDLAGD